MTHDVYVLEQRIGTLEAQVDQLLQDMKILSDYVDNMEKRVDDKFNYMENRIYRIDGVED